MFLSRQLPRSRSDVHRQHDRERPPAGLFAHGNLARRGSEFAGVRGGARCLRGGSSGRGRGGRSTGPCDAPAALALELFLVAAALGITASGNVQEAWRRDVVVALLALAMGVQNAMVRRMGVPEANTTVLTTSLGSLAADLVAVGGRPPRAGRRMATVACIFGGAVLGAELQRNGPTWSLVLALGLVASSAVALGRAGWPAPVD
ncbi:MAG TPA: YoaK family protein [Acidimicrobiales bacterium]